MRNDWNSEDVDSIIVIVIGRLCKQLRSIDE
jgi:hypothetical protein